MSTPCCKRISIRAAWPTKRNSRRHPPPKWITSINRWCCRLGTETRRRSEVANLARWFSFVLILAAFAMGQAPTRLATLTNNFLDSRSAAAELHLREYASSHGSEESG